MRPRGGDIVNFRHLGCRRRHRAARILVKLARAFRAQIGIFRAVRRFYGIEQGFGFRVEHGEAIFLLCQPVFCSPQGGKQAAQSVRKDLNRNRREQQAKNAVEDV